MDGIGLKEAIAVLRKELSEAIEAGEDAGLRFEVGEIVVEFQVEVQRSTEANVGLRFWVVEAGARTDRGRTTTHTVRMPLTPRSADGSPILTGAASAPRPQ